LFESTVSSLVYEYLHKKVFTSLKFVCIFFLQFQHKVYRFYMAEDQKIDVDGPSILNNIACCELFMRFEKIVHLMMRTLNIKLFDYLSTDKLNP